MKWRRTCGAKKRVPGFGWESERTVRWHDVLVGQKHGVTMLTGATCSGQGPVVSCDHGTQPPSSIKTELLSSSQEGMCSMQLATFHKIHLC
jgi:hypothetical protein